MFVGAQVLGQLLDAACDDGNLYLRRAGVRIVAMIIRDQFCFYFLSQWHDVCFFLSWILAAAPRECFAKRRTRQVSMPTAQSRMFLAGGPKDRTSHEPGLYQKIPHQPVVTRFRPFCLLLYINSSVLRTMLSIVSSGWLTLAPMETVTLRFLPPP